MEANQVNEAATVYLTTGKDIPETKPSEYLFAFQLTKGRIAESLVQELLTIELDSVWRTSILASLRR